MYMYKTLYSIHYNRGSDRIALINLKLKFIPSVVVIPFDIQ